MEKEINIDLLYEKIKEKKISLRRLAALTSISSSQLCMIFSHKRNLTVSKLNRILKETHIKIDDIIK